MVDKREEPLIRLILLNSLSFSPPLLLSFSFCTLHNYTMAAHASFLLTAHFHSSTMRFNPLSQRSPKISVPRHPSLSLAPTAVRYATGVSPAAHTHQCSCLRHFRPQKANKRRRFVYQQPSRICQRTAYKQVPALPWD